MTAGAAAIAYGAVQIYQNWGQIANFLTGFAGKIAGIGAAWGQSLADGIQSGWQFVIGCLSDAVARVMGLLDLDLTGVGLGWIQGLMTGLQSGLADLTRWVSNAPDEIVVGWMPDWVVCGVRWVWVTCQRQARQVREQAGLRQLLDRISAADTKVM